ncbi:ComEC/Rec2 family competence protein [Nocardioides marmoribigeumensis]|uniref:Competence protein ComEC n=1 Tax=Nocardioides marmoribigeumensis TaxID=433649 RepID=A0ABU2C0T0_9ACTN|nr:ComEC/Rec2 family competence protein [Nocardioides marmoribigeumensis]MDR7364260.1 competence protein ComEC [Nocardioides marmoribigeumensis]
MVDSAARGRDLRLLAPATAAWGGALAGGAVAGHVPTGPLVVLLSLGLVGLAVLTRRALPLTRTVAAVLLVAVALALVALLRAAGAVDGPVAALAGARPLAEASGSVRADPRVLHGRFADQVVFPVSVDRVVTRTGTTTARARVLVLAAADLPRPSYGERVRVSGRLAPSDEAGTAALLDARGVTTLARPSWVHRAADRVRAGIRAAARGPDPGSALVPALVDGDDARMPDGLVDDFRTSGLTHLTAVSGANLTLVLAFVLPVARRCGVRARGLLLVGLLCSVCFVLLARPEPSVLRAAVMGAVALVGLGVGGRRLGIRALSASVVLLLAVSPGLAASAGFALSVLATGGILLGAPPLRRTLAAHVPGPVADAVAVPVAAQLACTPLVAVLSAQVSLVAVAANLAAAPLVGPTTVLGLVGGLLATVWTPLGRPAGWVAAWCAQGIVEVAEVSSALPGAALDWATTPASLGLLTVLCLVLLVGLPVVLRRRGAAVGLALLMVVAVLRPMPAGAGWVGRILPGPDWPPRGWVLVACDVGQGDALVLHAGPHRAVVVDAGPEPRLVDRCLGRLGVREVTAVVLTHFHADHVDGLEGVLRGRRVGEIQVTGFAEPAYGAAYVSRLAAARGIPVRVPAYAEVVRAGALTWQVVAPQHLVDDNPNDASLVLLVVTRGLRLLLAGDVEPPSQAPLVRLDGLAPVDVIKVPHHGSAHQDDRLLQGLGASLGLVSVGEDNDYGHPSARTLALLRAAGTQVHRTDLEGDLAVVPGPDGPSVVGRG